MVGGAACREQSLSFVLVYRATSLHATAVAAVAATKTTTVTIPQMTRTRTRLGVVTMIEEEPRAFPHVHGSRPGSEDSGKSAASVLRSLLHSQRAAAPKAVVARRGGLRPRRHHPLLYHLRQRRRRQPRSAHRLKRFSGRRSSAARTTPLSWWGAAGRARVPLWMLRCGGCASVTETRAMVSVAVGSSSSD